MRLTVQLLGLDLLTIEIATETPTEEHDPAVHLSGGTTYSTPIGFTDINPRWETGTDYQ